LFWRWAKLVPLGGTGPETKGTSWLGRFSVIGASEASQAPVPKYRVLRPGLSTPLSVTSAPRPFHACWISSAADDSVGPSWVPYIRVMASFLPSLLRTPPAPAFQPAASSADFAADRSCPGRLPATLSPEQGFGETVTNPCEGLPLPLVSTLPTCSRSSACTSALRTAGSAPGCPLASLNHNSPSGESRSAWNSFCDSSRCWSGPRMVAAFSWPESSRFADVDSFWMTLKVTLSGSPSCFESKLPGPQVRSLRRVIV